MIKLNESGLGEINKNHNYLPTYKNSKLERNFDNFNEPRQEASREEEMDHRNEAKKGQLLRKEELTISIGLD